MVCGMKSLNNRVAVSLSWMGYFDVFVLYVIRWDHVKTSMGKCQHPRIEIRLNTNEKTNNI